MRPFSRSVLLAGALTATACSMWHQVQRGPIEEVAILENPTMESLIARASFEFDCPPADLDLHAITEFQLTKTGYIQPTGTSGVQVGVAGCGTRGVYVVRNMSEWVLNSAVEVRSPGAEAPASAEE